MAPSLGVLSTTNYGFAAERQAVSRSYRMAESDKTVHALTAVGIAMGAPSIATGFARMRTNLSFQQLRAAARLAQEVGTVEQQNIGKEFGAFYETILGSSLGCVVLSLAAAEAYINELFADRAEHFNPRDCVLLDLLLQDHKNQRLLEKFDLVCRIRAGAALDKGATHVQAMDRLIQLRNGIVHFQPEWDDEAPKHEKLSERLEGYVSRSPWFPDESLFPRAWATSRTTAWAVSTILVFVEKFALATGMPDRFGPHKGSFSTGI